MKSILLGVAVALVAGTAFAADMPVKAPAMAPPAPTWTGTYVGINGGYGWGTSEQALVGGGATSGTYNIKGGVAGVTYGGNWQAGHVVLGFETDFDWAHINGNILTGVCGGGICSTETKWLSTERMRAGWDFDGWLVYGTLGAAFADVKAFQGAACGGVLCGEKTRGGWTAGVGVETMFWRNWSAKLEYLHYDLGRDVTYNPGTPITVLNRGDLVRAGINYHFDMTNLLGLFH